MKRLKALLIILMGLFIFVGCDKKEETVEEETIHSGIDSEYINLTMVKPNTINPILNKEKSVGYITNLVYDSLFTIDENYNVVPQLVNEYGIAKDGMSIDIKLKDAKWHDGRKVTSEDVKFTVELIQKNANSPYNKIMENFSSISIVSENEFTINFKQSYPFSIDTLIFPIVSETKLESLSNNDMLNYKNNLVGCGPYKIEKYGDRGGIILTKNKDYYEELPETVKDIKVGIVPNEESQVAMVRALDSDIAQITLNDLSKFHEKQFNTITYEGRDYESLIFNYDNKFLRDVNFRKAIAHSIDKKKIVEEGYMGDAELINFPLNSNSKYYNKDIKTLDYSKDKAKKYIDKVNPVTDEELQNAKNEDKTNIKTKEDKTTINTEEKNNSEVNSSKDVKNTKNVIESVKKVNLKIVVNKNNTERVKTSYMIVENLKSIGIKATVEELEGKDLEDAINSKKYDLALVGWELSSIPDATSIIRASGYEDDKLNNYIESLSNATTQSQVEGIYKSIQKYINDNVAFISLAIRDEYMVTNGRLEGKISPNDFDVYDGIVNLSIKK